MSEEIERLRAELEQVKKERDEEWEDNYQLMHKINRVESELAAKDKALEWYGSEWVYLRHYVKHGDGENIISDSEVQIDNGYKARSILSQYKESSK